MRLASMFMAMILVVGTLIVPAAAVNSSSSSATVYGITYTYYSQLISHTDVFQVGIRVSVDRTVGEGYIGGKIRLYTSDGTLASATDWMYTGGSTSSQYGFASHYDPEPNTYYYSKGQVQFYNGNGYTTYTCNATPNISGWSRPNIQVTRNQNGEIYGSEVFLNQIGVEPDLIKAVGQNGVIGYVKADDLDAVYATCPEEAIEFSGNNHSNRVIMLYAEDGETVLGDYVIDNTNFFEVVYEN